MKQKIVPLGKDMTYIDAFNATKSRGGLPSNVLHDDTLMNASLIEKIRQEFSNYYAAWCREIIAYPDKHGVFGKGDIKDHSYNWMLSARYVPKSAIGKKGIALLIDPKDLQVSDGTTRIIPRKITILQKFPQTDGWYGYDKKTRIPIDEKPKSNEYSAKRYLWRWDNQSLCPLVRFDGDFYDRRDVDAYRSPDYGRLGVGVVEPQSKLSLGTDSKEVDETFKTRMLNDNKIQVPKKIKVKKGMSVEVNIKTL